MTVRELGDRMTEREFRDWCVLAQVDPYGQDREDWRHAQLVQAVLASAPNRRGSVPSLQKLHPRHLFTEGGEMDSSSMRHIAESYHRALMQRKQSRHDQNPSRLVDG